MLLTTKETQVINKMRKIKIKSYLQPLPWRVLLFLVLPSSLSLSLSLSLDGVSEWIQRYELRDQIHVLYIGILPSIMHLVAITTHYWLLQFISGHYHSLTVIQFGFQKWRAFQFFKMLVPEIITFSHLVQTFRLNAQSS